MPYDIEAAREAGVSDAEIAASLSKRLSYDLEGAKRAGLSDRQITDALVRRYNWSTRGQNEQTIGQEESVGVGKVLRENAPLIGSVVGGIVGTASPVPGGAFAGSTVLGPMIGSLIGTVAGTSIGTSAQQIAEQARGKKMSASEVLLEQGSNVAEQALWDVAGNVIGAGVAKGISKFSPVARSGAGIAEQALRKEGGTLSASQAVESPTLSLAESFARAGAGGKGQFIELDKRNADALQAIKDSLIQSITKDPVNDRVAGKVFQDAISKGDSAHQIASTALYKQFDQQAGNVLVDSLPTQKIGLDLAEQFKRIGNVGKSDAGGRLIDQLSNLPNTLTFSDAHILRSNLLATIRDLRASGTETRALKTATDAMKQIDASMEQSAKSLPKNLFDQYRQISAFYRKGKEAFSNEIVSELVRTQPERVGESLFRTGNVSEIIQAKASLRQAARFDNTVDESAIWKRLQAGYLNHLLTSRTAVNLEGETTAQNLMKQLADAKTDRQFAVMFNEQQRQAIADFGRTAYLTLRNKPTQFGILAPLLQAGAIGNLLSGGAMTGTQPSPLRDVGILVSPYVIANVLTNPKAVSVLIRGLKIPAEFASAGPVLTKLTADFAKAVEEKKD